jgi:hypothetical protein
MSAPDRLATDSRWVFGTTNPAFTLDSGHNLVDDSQDIKDHTDSQDSQLNEGHNGGEAFNRARIAN